LYKQWIRNRETFREPDSCANADGGDYIGKLEEFLSRVNWEGVVTREDWRGVIGFKDISKRGNVYLLLL
jgi:hypothetical protein